MTDPDQVPPPAGAAFPPADVPPPAESLVSGDALISPAAVTADLDDWALAVFQCRRCGHDFGRLAASARFCPRCGIALSEPPMVALPVYGPGPQPDADLPDADQPPDGYSRPPSAAVVAVLAEWDRLHRSGAFQEQAAPGRLQGRAADAGSQIVAGYAKALHRLGWRYETHLGLSRNLSEAVRCYIKAARLGNAEALARLAPGPTERAAPSSDPD